MLTTTELLCAGLSQEVVMWALSGHENGGGGGGQSHAAFNSDILTLPKAELHEYLLSCVAHSGCSRQVLPVTALYLQRCTVAAAPINAHRLLATALLLAAKYTDDSHCDNSQFAALCGVPVAELNIMERVFLANINWNLYVTGDDFESAVNALEAGGLKACAARLGVWHPREDSDNVPCLGSSISSAEGLGVAQTIRRRRKVRKERRSHRHPVQFQQQQLHYSSVTRTLSQLVNRTALAAVSAAEAAHSLPKVGGAAATCGMDPVFFPSSLGEYDDTAERESTVYLSCFSRLFSDCSTLLKSFPGTALGDVVCSCL